MTHLGGNLAHLPPPATHRPVASAIPATRWCRKWERRLRAMKMQIGCKNERENGKDGHLHIPDISDPEMHASAASDGQSGHSGQKGPKLDCFALEEGPRYPFFDYFLTLFDLILQHAHVPGRLNGFRP